jgi:hypothetical protein
VLSNLPSPAWQRLFLTLVADAKKKLVLLYLANDVLQNSRKSGPAFANAYSNVLPAAIAACRRHVLELRCTHCSYLS